MVNSELNDEVCDPAFGGAGSNDVDNSTKAVNINEKASIKRGFDYFWLAAQS